MAQQVAKLKLAVEKGGGGEKCQIRRISLITARGRIPQEKRAGVSG